MALRLLIVDDNAHFLHAARTLLEREGMRVVAVASTSADAIRYAGELQPDVTLVDIDLGAESGFDLARRLTDAGSAIAGRVVLISAYPESDLRDIIDASPAIAFLPKSQLSSDAIRRLLGDREGGGSGDGDGPGA
jgi:DNA-binding NarL/FixJ family response regulator